MLWSFLLAGGICEIKIRFSYFLIISQQTWLAKGTLPQFFDGSSLKISRTNKLSFVSTRGGDRDPAHIPQ